MPDTELAKPLLQPFLHMSNKEFKTKFGHVLGSWRGKKSIQRNAILALAHFKEESAFPELIEILQKDERSVIRGIAAWALGKIGVENTLTILQTALEREVDEEVRSEIQKGVELIKM